MVNQINVTSSNKKKLFRGGARALGVGWSGMSAYIRFSIVMVAALMALVV